MMVCFTTGESDNKEFRSLRDEVVFDSCVYHQKVVPYVVKTLGEAKDLFSFFD